MDDLNNPVLLGSRHLVVGGEAEASAEEICADVYALSLDVGICFTPAVTLDGDECMGAVDGLHMHGLPNSTCCTCYIGNLSSSRKKRIISCFMLFSAHFRCNAYYPSKLHGVPQCYSCDICFFSFSRSA